MRDINSILVNTDTLGNLYSHSMEIIKLQAIIRTALKKPLSDHVFLAQVTPEKIIIYTHSPAWAAKLRFLTTELLDIVKKFPRYKSVVSVRIKINPSLNPVSRAENNLSISPFTAQHLLTVAENISDPELQSSLLNLAQNR